MFDERGDLLSAIEEREVPVGRVWEKLCGCQENCSCAVPQFTIRTIRSTLAPLKIGPQCVHVWLTKLSCFDGER